jgi:cyclopropane-fatty-acyl-phospholipid synthase
MAFLMELLDPSRDLDLDTPFVNGHRDLLKNLRIEHLPFKTSAATPTNGTVAGSTWTLEIAASRRRDVGRRRTVEAILDPVDVRIDGDRPWDVRVRDERFFRRVLADGALGLGESYVEGWWNCGAVDELFVRLSRLDPRVVPIPRSAQWQALVDRFVNRQSKAAAARDAARHYDLGNDLFTRMLGRTMAYSCGYWKDARDLDQAQEAKLDLVCRKLDLRPGQRVLDIGCGWGSFLRHAATHYGVEALGINNSTEQSALGRELCRSLPVEIRTQDYREVEGRFDRIVSIGMFEHVGRANYGAFFDAARRCLADGGLFLLHTIGSNVLTRGVDAWTQKYIFPGSSQPTLGEIGRAVERRFIVEDVHNFGPDYDPTLMAWCANFEAGWEELRPRYGDAFFRQWTYFLRSSAGSFRSRRNQLWQIVLSKEGVPGGYRSVR